MKPHNHTLYIGRNACVYKPVADKREAGSASCGFLIVTFAIILFKIVILDLEKIMAKHFWIFLPLN